MTINLNGVEIYSAQEVEERIREAMAGKDKKVDMENLPIGSLVKVVDNSAGHCHDTGEILPITDVDKGILDELYRLDDRGIGWVAVDDIEFVSFPEEEESTSGDEGLPEDEEDDESAPKFEVGDTVKVLRNITEGYDEGTIGKVVEILPWGSLMIESDCGGPYSHPGSTLELVEESEDSEIKAGDIVIATEDEFDITEGNEYEIKERETGTLYFLDDDGDIRYVNVHEEYLRKKSAKRGFKKGDVVYVNEEITDNSGDTICPGVLAEFILDSGVLTPDESFVVVGDGDIGKLTLVCRAEDRLDK